MKGWPPLAAAPEMPVRASAPATATALPIPSILLLSFIVFPLGCGERPSGPGSVVSHVPRRLEPPFTRCGSARCPGRVDVPGLAQAGVADGLRLLLVIRLRLGPRALGVRVVEVG